MTKQIYCVKLRQIIWSLLFQNCIDIIKNNDEKLNSLTREKREIQEKVVQGQLFVMREEIAVLKAVIHRKNKSVCTSYTTSSERTS